MISGDRNQQQRYCSPAADSTTPLAEDFNLRNSTPPIAVIPAPYNFTRENKAGGKNHEREHPEHERQQHARQTRRAGAFPNRKWGGAKLQYRATAHHRDVHDPHSPLRRSQRLRRAESFPRAGADLPPARDAGRPARWA